MAFYRAFFYLWVCYRVLISLSLSCPAHSRDSCCLFLNNLNHHPPSCLHSDTLCLASSSNLRSGNDLIFPWVTALRTCPYKVQTLQDGRESPPDCGCLGPLQTPLLTISLRLTTLSPTQSLLQLRHSSGFR